MCSGRLQVCVGWSQVYLKGRRYVMKIDMCVYKITALLIFTCVVFKTSQVKTIVCVLI